MVELDSLHLWLPPQCLKDFLPYVIVLKRRKTFLATQGVFLYSGLLSVLSVSQRKDSSSL